MEEDMKWEKDTEVQTSIIAGTKETRWNMTRNMIQEFSQGAAARHVKGKTSRLNLILSKRFKERSNMV